MTAWWLVKHHGCTVKAVIGGCVGQIWSMDCFCGRFVWPAGLLRPKRGADGKKGSSRWLEGRSDQESWRSGGVDWQYQEERKGG